MGMFDTIESEQVKCFDCELNHYKLGDKIMNWNKYIIFVGSTILVTLSWMGLDQY